MKIYSLTGFPSALTGSFTGSFFGDGSGLTGTDSGSWDGQFTGSAGIQGSLEIDGQDVETQFTNLDVNVSNNTSAITLLQSQIQNTGSWDGIFSGSAEITGSLRITGSLDTAGTATFSSIVNVGGAVSSPASVGTFLGVVGRSGVGGGTAGNVLKDSDDFAWDIWNSGGGLNFRYNNGDSALAFSSGGAATFSRSVTMGDGSQAVNSDAILSLRTTGFGGLDIHSSRGAGNNMGGMRVYQTSNSTTIPVSQLLIEDDGSYNFYNGSNGAQKRLTISSGGDVEVSNLIKFVDPTAGSAGTPQFKTLISYQHSTINSLSTIKGGNEASGTNGTYLKFSVNSSAAVNTPIDILTLKSAFVGGTTAQFDALIKANNGISFPNQSAGSGTVSSSTLDAYEEGSWTNPQIQGTTTSGTVSGGTIISHYTRIGNVVHAYVRFSGVTVSNASGTIKITGLPYAAKSNTYPPTANFGINGLPKTSGSTQYFYLGSSSSLIGYEFNVGGNGTAWSIPTTATYYADISITYQV